jgi:hypothetical protein
VITLADASSFFDRTPVVDINTGRNLFYAQFDPYDDSRRDSATAYRRIMSVRAGTSMPSNRVVSVFGRKWIVGDSEIDGLEETHREKFVMHPARRLLNVSSLSGYLTSTVSATTWADTSWVKDSKEEETSSRAIPLYSVYLPRTAPVSEYSVLWEGAEAFLAQPVHDQASGIRTVTALKLEYPVVSSSRTTRTYDPVQGSYTGSTTTSLPCLRVRWQSLYRYGSMGDARFQEGDDSFVLPTGTTIATKDTLTVSGVVWNVLSVESLGGAVVVHGRRA